MTDGQTAGPRILVFAGSVKKTSINARLADSAQNALTELGAAVTRVSLADYDMPLVNEDLKNNEGIPDAAMDLGRVVAAHDGVFIASPEYNASIPPLVKNTVDWISLIREIDGQAAKPWQGRYVALGAASNGKLGGIRSLYQLRAVMMAVGCQVITEQCAVGGASDALGADGTIADERTMALLGRTCKSLVDHCKRHALSV
ncbi:NADPH-dependent FMN reductase [Hoeflea prorocentri]|uniref:NAD(P)H-dependent oxidoreductase n=1 Tax=Hoeflea prorocentri TaxID=1922333 RepID=A0A9X3ULT2_9HYPH|nr:NAD(P)H-dependent oxidoreductase [Hoeflea prorocentri]MCY6383108.1 NAD(P)H-dependent oxidoreductase [Hoeflea prorocentri]MDA5400908.1 NAD(P)H-dependent oxidoreductase [Hoeflea prorocentri]